MKTLSSYFVLDIPNLECLPCPPLSLDIYMHNILILKAALACLSFIPINCTVPATSGSLEKSVNSIYPRDNQGNIKEAACICFFDKSTSK